MFKIICLFFICMNLSYSLDIKTTEPLNAKLFNQWLEERVDINNEENLTIEICDNLALRENLYNKIKYENKIFSIPTLQIEDIGIKEGNIMELVSPWSKTSYLWKEKGVLYLNGLSFLENKELGDMLILYLEKEYKNIFTKKEKRVVKHGDSGVNLSYLVNMLLIIFGIGAVTLFLIVRRSVKNRYGDPFKR